MDKYITLDNSNPPEFYSFEKEDDWLAPRPPPNILSYDDI